MSHPVPLQALLLLRKGRDKVGVLRDKFAAAAGFSPTSLQLKFEGRILNLGDSAEEAGLEGDEDILVTKASVKFRLRHYSV